MSARRRIRSSSGRLRLRQLNVHFRRDGRPKRVWASMEEAREQAIKYQQSAYECELCHKPHIGHSK